MPPVRLLGWIQDFSKREGGESGDLGMVAPIGIRGQKPGRGSVEPASNRCFFHIYTFIDKHCFEEVVRFCDRVKQLSGH